MACGACGRRYTKQAQSQRLVSTSKSLHKRRQQKKDSTASGKDAVESAKPIEAELNKNDT